MHGLKLGPGLFERSAFRLHNLTTPLVNQDLQLGKESGQKKKGKWKRGRFLTNHTCIMYVCVCECVREREREKPIYYFHID